MEQERRDEPDRRKGERRTTGRVVRLTDSNFEREMLDIPVFGLVLFTRRDSTRCKKQEEVLREVARDFWKTQRLRVGFFEVSETNNTIAEWYRTKRLPTLILFRQREIVYRTSHPQTAKALKKIINGIMATDPKVFVERRHKGDRRRALRREESPESVVWNNLIAELNTTPWPIVLAVKPRDHMRAHKFATMVEAATEKLQVPGLKTLHVVGRPTEAVRKHFPLTIEPPGVAVFRDGRLLGEIIGMGSKATLIAELRKMLE